MWELLSTAMSWLELFEDYCSPNQLSLKWPNDVLWNGRKIAGVLAERKKEQVSIGVGVNVNNSPEIKGSATTPPPTSIVEETGRSVSRRRLLFSWVNQFFPRLVDTEGNRLYSREDIESRMETIGRRVRVDELSGRAQGLHSDGGLIIEDEATNDTAVIHEGDTWEVLGRS